MRGSGTGSLRLDGGCQAPIAGHAHWLDEDTFQLEGMVAALDGSAVIRREVTGRADEARRVGLGLAADLLAAGADRLLAAAYNAPE